MNKYEVISNIGEGAYGVVLQCRNKETNELVAIKRFKESDEDELVRKTTLREVKILRLLKEETHVVHLLEAFRRKGKLYLVFEYVGCNLLDVLEKHPQGLEMEDVKRMIFTLLLGVRACHVNSVIHRDIKPENLLVHSDNTLRLCDFGFARIYNTSMDDLTDYVATRWYRSPELLLGTTNYGLASDMWAVGCIMAEMIDGQALFPGESELDQIFMIQKLLGNFTPQQVEVFRRNKRFTGESLRDVQKTETTLDRKYGRKASRPALNFLRSLLVIDPEKRLTVDEAIHHQFFEGMIELFAPHLKLAIPLIRPSTASRYQQQQQQQQQQAQQMVEQPPRPTSTTIPLAEQQPQVAQQQSSSSTPNTANITVPAHVAMLQQQQQPSSRVSVASSNSTIPGQANAAVAAAQRSSSFLPTRLGSGSRRPPSQQQQRPDMVMPQPVVEQPVHTTYTQVPMQSSAMYGAPVNTQMYSIPQQQSVAQPMNRAAFQMPPTGQLQAGAMPSYLVNARGNLPRLGPTYQGVQPAGAAQFAPRFNGGFVNGGHNPVPRQAASGNTSENSNQGTSAYRPPPSQQTRRYGY
jgi:cyclin-dependent kinase-like